MAKTGTNTSFIGSTATGSNLIFQNAGGTISVASGGELQFEDGGTFTGVTTLNTSAGAGKIDFARGTFTVDESASFQGGTDDLTLFMESTSGTLAIEGDLTLDVLTLAGGDVQIDSNNTGVSTLGVGQLRVISTGSSIIGSNTTTPDDVLNIGASGFNLQQNFELSALTANSTGTATDTGNSDDLNLTGKATFNNTGVYELQDSDSIVSSDGTGTFINAGTLAKTGTGTSFIGSTSTTSNLTFQNTGGIISVASGGELQFNDGGTFTGATTLNTAAGAGKVDFNTGTFTVAESASFQGNTDDLALFMESANGLLAIEGNLTLDVLTLAGGAVQIDSNNTGVSTLGVGQLGVTSTGSSIIGSNTTTPDDVLNIGASGFTLQQNFELSALTVNSTGTATDTGNGDVLNLTGKATFNNTGIYELQDNDSIVSSDGTGTFINAGTLAKTGTGASSIGSTSTVTTSPSKIQLEPFRSPRAVSLSSEMAARSPVQPRSIHRPALARLTLIPGRSRWLSPRLSRVAPTTWRCSWRVRTACWRLKAT